MKKFLAWVVLAFALAPALVLAAGTVVETITWVPGQSVKQIKYHWTYTEGDTDIYQTMSPFNGYIRRLSVGVPTTTASADSDIRLMAVDGEDEAVGQFVDWDGASVKVYVHTNYYSYGPIGFSMTGNAIDDAEGDFYIYVDVPK